MHNQCDNVAVVVCVWGGRYFLTDLETVCDRSGNLLSPHNVFDVKVKECEVG